jgi:hypothetical protein
MLPQEIARAFLLAVLALPIERSAEPAIGRFNVAEREYRRRNGTKVPRSAKNKFLDRWPGRTAKILFLDVEFNSSANAWVGGQQTQAGRSRDAYRSSCPVD